MNYFCTLFDSNYLSRGFAMYESLKRHTKNFHLYVLAFDEKCERILRKLSLENMTVISLEEFEDEELKEVKKSRSRGEYCWTCTPSLVKYCLEKYNLDMCTYVDADIYFYADPQPLFEEMGEKSVLISPHWYTPVYDQSVTSGIYCVQFVVFRNDEKGMKVLEWWRRACNDWCYARVEEGKFGDQKYLDDWPTRFEGVHVLQHRGGGVAPWNVQQYEVCEKEERGIFLRMKKNSHVFSMIFYHFHNLRFLEDKKIDLGTYLLPYWVKHTLYKPYVRQLLSLGKALEDLEKGDYHGILVLRKDWKRKFLSLLGRVNLMRVVFFHFFNLLFQIFPNNVDKKKVGWVFFLARLLTMYHNTYSLRYFGEE